MKRKVKTFALEELVDIDIDSFVEAMGHLNDDPVFHKEALAMADEDTRREYKRDECPGVLEDEYTALARRDKFRFDKKGNIVSFDRYHK